MSTNSTTTAVNKPVTYTIDNVSVSDLIFTDVIKNQNGQKRVYVNVKSPGNARGNRLLLQTPLISAPFGMTRFESKPKPGAESKPAQETSGMGYSIQLSFNEAETNPKIQALYDFIEGIETRVKSHAVEKSVEWFEKTKNNQPRSADSIEEGFTTSLPKPKDPKYKPTFRVKVNAYKETSGVVSFGDLRVFNAEKNTVAPLDGLVKHCKGRFIVQLDYIWFMRTEFGIKWSLKQVRLNPTTKLPDYAFVDDDDDVDVDSSGAAAPVESAAVAHISDADSAEDGDGDAADSDDELSAAIEKVTVAVPPPSAAAATIAPVVAAAVAPATKKRTVVKTK